MGSNVPAPYQFISKQVPGQYQASVNSITVGVGPTVVAKSDPERMSLAIMNIGGTAIYISPTLDVSTTKGLLLLASGGVFVANYLDDLMLQALPWYAVSDVAGGTVCVVDVSRFAAAPAV